MEAIKAPVKLLMERIQHQLRLVVYPIFYKIFYIQMVFFFADRRSRVFVNLELHLKTCLTLDLDGWKVCNFLRKTKKIMTFHNWVV